MGDTTNTPATELNPSKPGYSVRGRGSVSSIIAKIRQSGSPSAQADRRTGGKDAEGPLFRPLRPDGCGFVRRHLDRKTPWRLVKRCAAGRRGSTPTAWGSA